jgi:hypothetical protein
VADVEEDHSKDDHATQNGQKTFITRKIQRTEDLHALQADKGALVVERRSTVSRTQLVNSEDTSDEDDKDSQADESHEPLEPPVDSSARDFAGFDVSAVAESVLDRQHDEDEDDGYLERETRQTKVHADLGGSIGLGR